MQSTVLSLKKVDSAVGTHNRVYEILHCLIRLLANEVCHLIAVGFQTYGERIYNICPSEGREFNIYVSPSLQTEGNILYYTTGLKTRGY